MIRVERRKPEFEVMEPIEEEEPQGLGILPISDNASSQFERERDGERTKPGMPEVQNLGAALTNS